MISIVIPVYRVEPYLEKCIYSVLNQTFQDWELILVDDGSPDKCGEICDRFAETDARIRVIHQQNAGLSAARNAGMKTVRGEYVTFIDSDDFVDADYLSSLDQSVKENNADIAVTGYRFVDESGMPYKNEIHPETQPVTTGKEACIRLMTGEETFMITACGKLYSHSLFHRIHYPEGRINEDEYVTYQLFYESGCVSFTGRNSYNYMKREGSIVSHFTAKHLVVADAFSEAVSYFIEKQDQPMVLLAKKRFLKNGRVLYLKGGDLPETERKNFIRKWKTGYLTYRKDLKDILTVPEKLLNWFFNAAPDFYAGVHRMMHRT